MNAVCPNPLCGTSYNLTPQHIGRQFVCRKCGSVLAAEADGLHLASETSAAPHAAPAPAAGPSAAGYGNPAPTAAAPTGGGAGFSGRPAFDPSALVQRARTHLFTLLFGAGAFLTIVFLFFPLIDKMKVDRRRAHIDLGNLKQKQAQEE